MRFRPCVFISYKQATAHVFEEGTHYLEKKGCSGHFDIVVSPFYSFSRRECKIKHVIKNPVFS